MAPRQASPLSMESATAPPAAAPEASETIPGSGSQDGLVAVSSRAAFYKRNTNGERGMMAALAAILLLLALVVALSIALAIIAYRYNHYKPDVCSTTSCVRAADNLLQSMDPSVSPCNDFYRFACGHWPNHHPKPDHAISNDWFADRSERMARRIREFLSEELKRTDRVPVQQAKRLYTSCTDVQRLDSLGLAPMQTVLASVGLPLPLPAATSASQAFVLEDTIAAARLVTGRELLVGVGVYPDPRQRSVNRVVLTQPDSQSPLPAGSELDRREEKLRLRTLSAALGTGPGSRGDWRAAGGATATSSLALSYQRYVARVMMYAYLWNSTRVETPSLRKNFLDMARSVQSMESVIYRMTHPDGGQPQFDPEDMSVDDLQRIMDSGSNNTLLVPLDLRARCPSSGAPTGTEACRVQPIRMRLLLHRLFASAQNVTLDLENRDRMLLVNNPKYLRGLAAVLAVVDRTVLQNYLWWVMVETLSPHLDRRMRDLKVSYLEEVTDSHTQPARSLFCASAVNRMMGMAVSVIVADPSFRNNTGAKVAQMLADVREAFEARVDRLDWMDDRTKAATREKAAAMISFIGFPDWLNSPNSLEEYYAGLEVEDGEYLTTLLRISQLMVKTNLESLRSPLEEPGWVTDPTDVNAFHTFQANAVTVPIGILQFPFYDLGLEALNYGAIGSILGHELTHGFDDQGRQFDKNGNMRQWWSNTTVTEYVNKTECFVRQYSGYLLEEINAKVDGRLTLGENIADNGGLREALAAYKLLQKRLRKPEPRLAGMEAYSAEQLFFLAFANVWCEAWTPSSLRYDLANEHSPNHVRVRGVLENMQEFADAFHCPLGSPMNPNHSYGKCVIW